MQLRSIQSFKVPDNFSKSVPSKKKLRRKMNMIELGETLPVVVDKTGTIVDGYISYLAYKELGYSEAPFVSKSDFDYQCKLSPIDAVYKKQMGRCIHCGKTMTEPKRANKKRARGIRLGKFPALFEMSCFCEDCVDSLFSRDIDSLVYGERVTRENKLRNRCKYIKEGNLFCVYINKDNEVVDGFISLLAYKELGYKRVPCIMVDDDFSTNNMVLKGVLYEQQGGICYICGSDMTLDDEGSQHYATLDHVFPRSFGGSYLKHNLRCACKVCNCLKMNLPLTDELKKVIKYKVMEDEM